VTYLFDHNLSPRLAHILRVLHVDARALRDEFARNIKDPDLLRELGSRGWMLITCDTHIQTRPMEAAVFKASGVSVVFLSRFFEQMKLWDKAVWLLRYWPEIEKFADRVKPGTSGRIRRHGRIDLL